MEHSENIFEYTDTEMNNYSIENSQNFGQTTSSAPKFVYVKEPQNFKIYSETEKFGTNSEMNYRNFLKINNNMQPAVSTQTICTQKIADQPSTTGATIQPKPLQIPSKSIAPKCRHAPERIDSRVSSAATTTSQSQIQTESNSQPDLVVLIKSVLREGKLLRREVQNNKCKCSMTSCDSDVQTSKLNIPATSIEDFKNLENEVKQDSMKEKLLLQHLRSTSDTTHEKYIRRCLKKIITDEAACSFSWHGQHNNIPVKSFTILNILKEETIAKFNTVRSNDVEVVIKKWFQYAKDRRRREKK